MQNVSEEYLKAFRSRTKVDRIEGFILLTDGTVLNITEKDIVQGGLQTKNRVCGSSFDLGTFNVGEMQIRFIDNESLNHDFAGAMINLRYCLLIDKDNDTWEKVYIKPYFIDGESVKRKRNVISCRAYDNASKFDVEKPSEIVGSGLFEILTEICGFCNVPLVTTQEEFDSFPNADIIPDLSSTQIQSCRDIVMWIAQTVNCCAFIDYTGKVKLKPYSYEREQQDRNVYASERKSIEFSDSRTYLAYLSSYCNGEPKSYQLVHSFSGVDAEHVKEGAFSMPKNPLLAKLTPKQQDDVNKAYLDNAQFPARYIKAKGWVDPSLELLDVLRFVGGDIDVQKAIRNSLTEVIWKFRGDGTYTCNIVDEYTEEASATSTISTLSDDTKTQSTTIQRVTPKSQLEKRIDDLESRISSGSSGGAGAGVLTEYSVISDSVIKYNGTTYTAELADSGLISKITDDKGGEFSPTYADGVTDVALHNAAFLAVAMLSGLKHATSGWILTNLIHQNKEVVTAPKSFDTGITAEFDEYTIEICMQFNGLGNSSSNQSSTLFHTGGLSGAWTALKIASCDYHPEALDYQIFGYWHFDTVGDYTTFPSHKGELSTITLTVRKIDEHDSEVKVYSNGELRSTKYEGWYYVSLSDYMLLNAKDIDRTALGTVYQVRIYDRVLTDAEVAQNASEDRRCYG